MMKLWKIFMMAGAFASLLLLSAGGIASAALYNGDISETRFTVADAGDYVLKRYAREVGNIEDVLISDGDMLSLPLSMQKPPTEIVPERYIIVSYIDPSSPFTAGGGDVFSYDMETGIFTMYEQDKDTPWASIRVLSDDRMEVSNTNGRNGIYTKRNDGNYILPNVLGGRISSQTAAGIKLFLQLIK